MLAEDFDGNDSEITPSVPPSFQTCQYIDFIHDGIILDPRVTFTRASIGTRVNEVGIIEVVQNDIPRVDHDPITLSQKGLLIEEERTNTLLQSSNMLSSGLWLRVGTSVATSTDFPIFTSDGVFIVTGDGLRIYYVIFRYRQPRGRFPCFCVEAQTTLHNLSVGLTSMSSPILIWHQGLYERGGPRLRRRQCSLGETVGIDAC